MLWACCGKTVDDETVDHARFDAKMVVDPGHLVNDAPEQQGDRWTEGSGSSGDKPVVVTLLLEGDEDPVSMMQRGGVTLEWCGQRKVTKFEEQPMPHIVDRALALPTLYLHMLDKRFFLREGELNHHLRSGNDNSEIVLVLPEMYVKDHRAMKAPESVAASLAIVLSFLVSQGEAVATLPTRKTTGGSFSPEVDYEVGANVNRLYYRLTASRPKSTVTLDRRRLGIPDDAALYLFAENHASVQYASDTVRNSFLHCIKELPGCSPDLQVLTTFCKVFYEGGFAYNKKVDHGKAFIPVCVGVGALGVGPAFPGQAGIGTGYPYLMGPQFFRYLDTVPVSITQIARMSERHGRYGICFTRSVFVWDGGALASEGRLDFCAPAPHGGFFYLPLGPEKYQRFGALLYAFGEVKEELEVSANVGSTESAKPRQDLRVCVICLSEEATLACVPCGHRSYCAPCAKQGRCRGFPSCPVCRTSVTDVLRVY